MMAECQSRSSRGRAARGTRRRYWSRPAASSCRASLAGADDAHTLRWRGGRGSPGVALGVAAFAGALAAARRGSGAPVHPKTLTPGVLDSTEALVARSLAGTLALGARLHAYRVSIPRQLLRERERRAGILPAGRPVAARRLEARIAAHTGLRGQRREEDQKKRRECVHPVSAVAVAGTCREDRPRSRSTYPPGRGRRMSCAGCTRRRPPCTRRG
jgi:hypothetical protein